MAPRHRTDVRWPDPCATQRAYDERSWHLEEPPSRQAPGHGDDARGDCLPKYATRQQATSSQRCHIIEEPPPSLFRHPADDDGVQLQDDDVRRRDDHNGDRLRGDEQPRDVTTTTTARCRDNSTPTYESKPHHGMKRRQSDETPNRHVEKGSSRQADSGLLPPYRYGWLNPYCYDGCLLQRDGQFQDLTQHRDDLPSTFERRPYNQGANRRGHDDRSWQIEDTSSLQADDDDDDWHPKHRDDDGRLHGNRQQREATTRRDDNSAPTYEGQSHHGTKRRRADETPKYHFEVGSSRQSDGCLQLYRYGWLPPYRYDGCLLQRDGQFQDLTQHRDDLASTFERQPYDQSANRRGHDYRSWQIEDTSSLQADDDDDWHPKQRDDDGRSYDGRSYGNRQQRKATRRHDNSAPTCEGQPRHLTKRRRPDNKQNCHVVKERSSRQADGLLPLYRYDGCPQRDGPLHDQSWYRDDSPSTYECWPRQGANRRRDHDDQSLHIVEASSPQADDWLLQHRDGGRSHGNGQQQELTRRHDNSAPTYEDQPYLCAKRQKDDEMPNWHVEGESFRQSDDDCLLQPRDDGRSRDNGQPRRTTWRPDIVPPTYKQLRNQRTEQQHDKRTPNWHVEEAPSCQADDWLLGHLDDDHRKCNSQSRELCTARHHDDLPPTYERQPYQCAKRQHHNDTNERALSRQAENKRLSRRADDGVRRHCVDGCQQGDILISETILCRDDSLLTDERRPDQCAMQRRNDNTPNRYSEEPPSQQLRKAFGLRPLHNERSRGDEQLSEIYRFEGDEMSNHQCWPQQSPKRRVLDDDRLLRLHVKEPPSLLRLQAEAQRPWNLDETRVRSGDQSQGMNQIQDDSLSSNECRSKQSRRYQGDQRRDNRQRETSCSDDLDRRSQSPRQHACQQHPGPYHNGPGEDRRIGDRARRRSQTPERRHQRENEVYRRLETRCSGDSREGLLGHRIRSNSTRVSRGEAALWQQIQWGRQMADRGATPETILSLFAASGSKFSARNLSTAAHRVAKLGCINHDLQLDHRVLALADVCCSRVCDFEANHLAITAWAFAKVGIEATQLFGAIADVVRLRVGKFNPQNISITAWAFAKAGVEAPLLFGAIADMVPLQVGDFNPRNISITAWAFAKAGVEAPQLFGAIADVVRLRAGEFNPQNISITAWAFAKSGVEAPQLFGAIADTALSRMRRFNEQELANTVWAFAKAGVEAPQLFSAITDEALARLSKFDNQSLANTAWAFSKAGVQAPQLFDAIADAAQSRIGEFSAQGLANTVWAFAKSGVKAPRLFGAIADVARVRLSEFNAQNLANTAWAFANAGFEAPQLFGEIADATQSQVGEFSTQELANTAWAFAKAGVEAPQLFGAIADAARARACEFNERSIANTMWAFATAGVQAPQLFHAIADAAQSQVGEFSTQELANTAWAFAKACVEATQLFGAIAEAARGRLNEFSYQDLANMAWAYACADWKKDPLFLLELGAAAVADLDALDPRGLSQLHLVSLHFHIEWPELSSALLHHQQTLQSAYQRRDPTPSQLQRNVATAMDRIGLAHIFEYVTAEGMSLDMAQPVEKRAVEVDGPTHFVKGTRTANASTRFKSRLLRRLGWKIVHIPFFEWRALNSEAEQDWYLRAKFQLSALA